MDQVYNNLNTVPEGFHKLLLDARDRGNSLFERIRGEFKLHHLETSNPAVRGVLNTLQIKLWLRNQ